ncbi:MAG: hypothetical protein ACRDWN_03955 [Acidimicrobiales bacterium]
MRALRSAGSWCIYGSWAGDRDPVRFPADHPSRHGSLGPGDPPGEPARRRLAGAVDRLLRGLGDTPGHVAGSLHAAGVRGVPNDPGHQPVGRYLAAVVGADPDVSAVSVDGAAVSVAMEVLGQPVVTVALPRPVRDFTAAFDRECYPTLVSAESTGSDR